MRLLTVSHFFESHGGGIERVAGQLCRQFSRAGIDAVWAASGADPAPDAEVRAVPLDCFNPTERLTGLPMPIPGLGAIRSLVKEVRQADTLIVHDALYVTSILALLIAKAFGKRVILIQHIAAIPFSSRLLTAVMRLANLLVTRPMLWAADERIFISDTVRRELMGEGAPERTHLLFNGVDTAIFHPGRRGRRRAPKERELLFVGRYVEKKGLAVLRALASSRPDLSIRLVGSGPIDPSGWGLPNVEDLGLRSPRELSELYRSSDLLLLPSVGEGFPLVIQEAMASGLPVICGEPTDRADPAAAQWLKGVRIDLADAEDSAARCAEEIDRFVVADAERSAMAAHAAQNYDWQLMARSIAELARSGSPAAASLQPAA